MAERNRLTEQERLQIVMDCATRIARQYRIADPCELWGAGWEACEVATASWRSDGGATLRGHVMRSVSRTLMRESINPRGSRGGKTVSGAGSKD